MHHTGVELLLGSHDLADLILHEVSAAGRDFVQSLWQVLLGDLGTYAITAFPLRDSFCTAIGHLIMNYQVAMHLKLSTMS